MRTCSRPHWTIKETVVSLASSDDPILIGPPGHGKSYSLGKILTDALMSTSPLLQREGRLSCATRLRAAERTYNELSLVRDIAKANDARWFSPLLEDFSHRAIDLRSFIERTARETVRAVPVLDIAAGAAGADDVHSWLLAPSANGLADDDRLASWALRAGAYIAAPARLVESTVFRFLFVQRPSDGSAAVRDLVRGLQVLLRILMAVLLAALSRGTVGYAFRASLIAVYLRYGRRSDEPSLEIALSTRRHIRLAEMVPAQH